MNVFRKAKVRIGLIVLVLIFSVGFNMNVFAAEEKLSPSATLTWIIPEEEDGIVVPIWCGATCHLIYSEQYTNNDGNSISFTRHEAFTYAEGWDGDVWGYDLYVNASGSADYYDRYSNYIKSANMYQDSNVIVDPSWIWDDRIGTDKATVNTVPAGAYTYASFYCPDAISANTQYVSCKMTGVQ